MAVFSSKLILALPLLLRYSLLLLFYYLKRLGEASCMSEQSKTENDAAAWERFTPDPATNIELHDEQVEDIADPDYTGPAIERDPVVEKRLDDLEKEID